MTDKQHLEQQLWNIANTLRGKIGIKQAWLAEKLNESYYMGNSFVQTRIQASLVDLCNISEILNAEIEELLVKRKVEDG